MGKSKRAASAVSMLLVLTCVLIPKASAQSLMPVDTKEVQSEGFLKAAQGLPAAASEEFDSTVFDIYLNDTPSGVILTTFTEQWCQIEEPSDVIEQVRTKLKGGFSELSELLKGRIELKREVPGVGSVECDLSSFRIVLAPDSRFMTVEKRKSMRLPDPEQSFAVQQTLQGVASGEVSKVLQTSAVSHRTMMSYGKYSARGEGTFFNDTSSLNNELLDTGSRDARQGYRLTELSGTAFWGIVRQDAGLLRSSGSNLVGTVDYLGSRFENSELLFVDQYNIRGSTLQIYVPTRSRVDFFQGSRLIGSQVLTSGLQEVDTRTFPSGSYDVDVVINQTNGSVTRERHFFTKSGLLASASTPVVTLEGGVIRQNTRTTGVPLYHAGLRWRALSFLELDPNVYGNNRKTIASAGLVGLYHEEQLSAQYAQGSDGTNGAFASLSGALPGAIGWSLNATKTSGDTPTDVFDDPFDDADTLEIAPGVTAWSAMIEKSFGTLRAYYSAMRNRQAVRRRNIFERPQPSEPQFTEPRYARGPGVDWRIYADRRNAISLRLAYLNTDSGDGWQAWLGYTRQLGDHWNWQTAGESNTAQQDLRRASTQLQYSNLTQADRGFTWELREDLQRQRLTNTQNDEQLVSTMSSRYAHDLFKASANLLDQRARDESATDLSIYGDTSVLYTPGEVTVGYGANLDSAVVVELKTQSGIKGDFDVLVNGSVYDTIPIGRSVIVGLSPFRTYRVAVRQPAKEKEMISYDSAVYEFTLFPGNFVRRSWDVERMFIVVGRIVDESGEPIPLQRIRGAKEYTITEEDGSFQAELQGGEALHISSQKYQCTIKLPELKGVQYLWDLGDLKCVANAEEKKTEVALREIHRKRPVA